MSYNFIVSEKNPTLYIPVNVRNNGIPVDLVSNGLNIYGSFSILTKKSVTLGDTVVLPDQSYLKSESGSLNSSISVGIWFYKDEVEENKSIFFCGSSSEGFGASISEQNLLRIYRSGSASYVTSTEIPEGLNFILFSVDESLMSVYFNGESVYSTASFSMPENTNFYLGSLWNEIGAGGLEFTQIFQIESDIDEKEVKALYELGVFGRQSFYADSQSNLLVSDGEKNFLQTSWQAYGIVTVKG